MVRPLHTPSPTTSTTPTSKNYVTKDPPDAQHQKFSELRDEARRDTTRARRIDEAKERATDEIVSYRLAELRRALGITQAELATMIGKSQSAISQLEHGEIGLSLETLRSIVHQLGGEIEITAVFDDRRVTDRIRQDPPDRSDCPAMPTG